MNIELNSDASLSLHTYKTSFSHKKVKVSVQIQSSFQFVQKRSTRNLGTHIYESLLMNHWHLCKIDNISKVDNYGENICHGVLWCLTRRQPDPIHCHKQLHDSIDYPILLLSSSAFTVLQPTIYFCVLLFDNFNLQTIVYFYLQINLCVLSFSISQQLIVRKLFHECKQGKTYKREKNTKKVGWLE